MGRVNSQADSSIVGQRAFQVVPSDSANLDTSVPAQNQAYRLYIGGAGIVTCVPARGQTSVAITVNAGFTLPFAVRKVLVTGTTATLMVAYY